MKSKQQSESPSGAASCSESSFWRKLIFGLPIPSDWNEAGCRDHMKWWAVRVGLAAVIGVAVLMQVALWASGGEWSELMRLQGFDTNRMDALEITLVEQVGSGGGNGTSQSVQGTLPVEYGRADDAGKVPHNPAKGSSGYRNNNCCNEAHNEGLWVWFGLDIVLVIIILICWFLNRRDWKRIRCAGSEGFLQFIPSNANILPSAATNQDHE